MPLPRHQRFCSGGSRTHANLNMTRCNVCEYVRQAVPGMLLCFRFYSIADQGRPDLRFGLRFCYRSSGPRAVT